MRVAFFGATRGMGRALARLMAERKDRLFLLGRDTEDLEKSARDLEQRGAPSPCGTVSCDLAEPEGFGPALDAARAALGGLDCVVVSAGVFGTQEALEASREAARSVTTLDFAHTVLFCEEARTRLFEEIGRAHV